MFAFLSYCIAVFDRPIISAPKLWIIPKLKAILFHSFVYC